METIIQQLKKKENARALLSQLRKEIKEDTDTLLLLKEKMQKEDYLTEFLQSEDAKTRKNAALLLGDLVYQPAAQMLWESYEKEQTRFVKSAYLQALYQMDAAAYVEQIKAKMEQLVSAPVEEESRKHMEEELRALRRLLVKYQGISHHTLDMKNKKVETLLITNRAQREFIHNRIPVGRATPHPLGILVETDQFWKLAEFRLYRELLFPVHLSKGKLLPDQPRAAASTLWESDLYAFLREHHEGDDCFYFRIEIKSPMTLEQRSDFSKKLSAELEHLSGGKMVNSTSDYEVELRLVANRDGKFFPCVKLYTYEDKRFSYRRNSIAASIHPSTAALIMELAEPYLKERAQVMDPFCGVGTMLMERAQKGAVHDVYGTDIFGEAIEKARENTRLAGMDFNYIHRDFFDFSHAYRFDEMISNLPVRGKKTKEQMEGLLDRFFQKAEELLTEDAILVLYTNEGVLLKRALQKHGKFKLLEQMKIQTKGEYELMIIGAKG